ncbi:MAG: hypothetical protein FJ109_17945, partial [Deltaproteobacteria bacterium]|nr:hypothetical protein [Deltaproteobacteria bacterium]
MRRLYVHQRSDGCIESFLDFARSRAALEAGGWTLCTHPEEADLVLVNTCIVGEIVEQHCVEDIRSLRQRMRPEAELVVTGCMPDYNADSLARLGVSFMFRG